MSPNKAHSAKFPVIRFGSTQEERWLLGLGKGLDVLSPCCGHSVLAALLVQTFSDTAQRVAGLHGHTSCECLSISFQRKHGRMPGDTNLLTCMDHDSKQFCGNAGEIEVLYLL